MRKKGDHKPLSPEKAAKIIAYGTMKLSNREIRDRLFDDHGIAVDQRTVGRIRKRQIDRRTVKRSTNPGSGRPRKTTERVDHTIKRLALGTRKQSITQLSNSVEGSTGVRLCRETIRSRLSEDGIGSFTCARKPLISKNNRRKRKNWAKAYSGKDIDFWKNSAMV